MKGIVGFLIRMVVLNIVLLPLMVIAPAICLTVPFYMLATDPHRELSPLACALLLVGPLSCAFYMLVSCHLPTVRKAHREGRLHEWRDDAGGYRRTIPKAFAFMLMGLFGSIFCEVAFCSLLHVPNGNPWGAAVWFAMLPFATFAPVILLWLLRWMRGTKNQDFIGRMKNDRTLQQQLRAASLYARTLRERDAQATWDEEK